MKEEKPNKTDLRRIFLGLQDQMKSSLSATREIIQHPGAKGDAAELHWLNMLNTHLPERYRADKAFVLDCDGNISDEIDIVIYDRQYSPFLFNQNFAKYIPAESVYAVLEVRQELSAANVAYAGEKAASVRKLRRTSAPIPYAGGTYEPKPPPRILAGIVALESEWNPPIGDALREALEKLSLEGQIDLGCALGRGGFEARYSGKAGVSVEKSGPDAALIFFFLRLLARLQESGTVAAIDLSQYGRVL
jgi:Domain of unknown function (DUF6602)